MTELYFSVLTPGTAIYNGKHVLENTGTAYNGYLAGLSTAGGSVTVSAGSALGMFYDFLALQETPSSAELVANIGGERVNFAEGVFEALVGKDLFNEATLPALGDKLYDNANGKLMHAASTLHKCVGICLSRSITVQNKAGAQEVVRCKFDFTQIL